MLPRTGFPRQRPSCSGNPSYRTALSCSNYAGNPTTELEFDPDAHGRTREIKWRHGGNGSGNPMITLAEYKHHGGRPRERKLHYSSTQIGTTTMDYDAFGRIAEITDTASIGQLNLMEFDYDSAGSLTSGRAGCSRHGTQQLPKCLQVQLGWAIVRRL